MLKFNNNHIFTGYLKQLLSNFNLPNCRVYTRDYAEYLNKYGKEDPRVLESIGTLGKGCMAMQTNYIKDYAIQHYYWNASVDTEHKKCYWKKSSESLFDPEVSIPGLTRTLKSNSIEYDTITHEYLGDYLRFIRDFYEVDLMSMYNCFNNKIYSNISCNIAGSATTPNIVFNSFDSNYRIYAFPVKLFEKYTIAIDSFSGVEMFCGFYGTSLETLDKSKTLITKTYTKLNNCSFKTPFLFDKLTEENWNLNSDMSSGIEALANEKRSHITRWDVAAKEKNLKLFIKVPSSCKSSIVVLEGDYRHYNDYKYSFEKANNTREHEGVWKYQANHAVVNLSKQIDHNNTKFKPISKLQLLELNTGESYPFATRLIEYLSGNTITSLDPIADNIKRVQKVASQNQQYFRIEGIWDPKLQKLVYEQLMSGGPFEVLPVEKTVIKTQNGVKEAVKVKNFNTQVLSDGTKVNIRKLNDLVIKEDDEIKSYYKANLILKQKPNQTPSSEILVDSRRGLQPRNGHNSKSTLYDILGYIDKDAEKWYSSWKNIDGKATMQDSVQNVDIYNGLYDIE